MSQKETGTLNPTHPEFRFEVHISEVELNDGKSKEI